MSKVIESLDNIIDNCCAPSAVRDIAQQALTQARLDDAFIEAYRNVDSTKVDQDEFERLREIEYEAWEAREEGNA